MITVGLDFGTHQTKICIEKKEGVECSYSFVKYKDDKGVEHYTIPSVISINNRGLLSYGFISNKDRGTTIRYFKQSAFCTSPEITMSQSDAMYFSAWYLAYILFDLEERYGKDCVIQMGAPTDSGHYEEVKQVAVRILVSAYRLVEDVFQNDKAAFLSCNIESLKDKTEIVSYSDEIKDEYGILVFPEAYACLKPLTSRGKIATGMSLMIDIGGGTTDVSFFTIENKLPQVYDFFSINKGLNYLTNALKEEQQHLSDLAKHQKVHSESIFHKILSRLGGGETNHTHNNIEAKPDSNVHSVDELDPERIKQYVGELKKECNLLIQKLQFEFTHQTKIPLYRLNDALQSRPLIYTGGGSTFKRLQVPYFGFKDKKLISHQEWDTKSIVDVQEIIKLGLCPILSTSYGLAISVASDNIERKPFTDIFDKIRSDEYEEERQSYKYQSSGRSFSAYDDWDAIK